MSYPMELSPPQKKAVNHHELSPWESIPIGFPIGFPILPAVDPPRTALAPRYWSWNGGPREGRGMEAMEKGGQIVGAGGAGGGWECLGTIENGPFIDGLPIKNGPLNGI